jgi:mTERF domain-containing protein
MVTNIALLREVGASQSTISFLVTNSPYVAFIKSSRFVKAVQEVKEMGFDPSKIAFAKAIVVVLTANKPTWEYKLEIFRRWGWSKEDSLFAFKRNPNCIPFGQVQVHQELCLFSLRTIMVFSPLTQTWQIICLPIRA